MVVPLLRELLFKSPGDNTAGNTDEADTMIRMIETRNIEAARIAVKRTTDAKMSRAMRSMPCPGGSRPQHNRAEWLACSSDKWLQP